MRAATSVWDRPDSLRRSLSRAIISLNPGSAVGAVGGYLFRLENNHLPYGFAGVEAVEALVDLVQRQSA